MEIPQRCNLRKKAVIIMGATATGKSKLSVDLAIHFPMEVINCDKIQVYRGLDILTNKISEVEMRGVPHHLLSVVEPNSNFTCDDFCFHALRAMNKIVSSDKIPIIVGGSNSFIEALVKEPSFKSSYSCCYIWLDVSMPILQSYVAKRVDDMVATGLVTEVKEMYDPEADNDCGIRRAIGVPEMDKYLKTCTEANEAGNENLLKIAIEEIKTNTCALVNRQLGKIHRLRNECGWPIHRVDATLAFEKHGKEAKEAWEEQVLKPSVKVVRQFLEEDGTQANVNFVKIV